MGLQLSTWFSSCVHMPVNKLSHSGVTHGHGLSHAHCLYRPYNTTLGLRIESKEFIIFPPISHLTTNMSMKPEWYRKWKLCSRQLRHTFCVKTNQAGCPSYGVQHYKQQTSIILIHTIRVVHENRFAGIRFTNAPRDCCSSVQV